MSSRKTQNGLERIISDWDLSAEFKDRLLQRESYFCIYCAANFRQRAHANAILTLTGHASMSDLFRSGLKIYETANKNIIRLPSTIRAGNYICSEYFDGAEPGSVVKGVRHEDLQKLTFADDSFDVLINSDVLEHVADLPRVLSEIYRVLKPGGFHIFTVPVDELLTKSRERAIITNGQLVHLLPPEMHGDTIRGEGILAFRDFGQDILDYLKFPGTELGAIPYYLEDKYITSVYYARKVI